MGEVRGKAKDLGNKGWFKKVIMHSSVGRLWTLEYLINCFWFYLLKIKLIFYTHTGYNVWKILLCFYGSNLIYLVNFFLFKMIFFVFNRLGFIDTMFLLFAYLYNDANYYINLRITFFITNLRITFFSKKTFLKK